MSKILELLEMSYNGSMLSPDGNTFTMITQRYLIDFFNRPQTVNLQIQITEKSREEYHFMIYGLGSLNLLRSKDGYCDEDKILKMMHEFNTSHDKPISLGMDRNGEFLLFSSGFFPNLPPNPSLDDIEVIRDYARDMVEFFDKNIKTIKKIVSYFGWDFR